MGAVSSKLKVGEEIGRGAYGTVHRGVYEGRPVAVKKIHRILLDYARNDPEAFQRISSEFERECQLLKTLVCPNVVQFMGVFEISGERVLVMELLHETLADVVKRKKGSGGLTEKEAGGICNDIACGLTFFHGQNPPLVHRDLNAKNILLTVDGTAKISDLGVSKFCPTDLGYLSTKAPGCLLYMPPEALGKEPKYTEKLDMFSFGVLMLQMVTGEDPNPDMQGIGVVPEVERRKDHIELVPANHVLKKGILQCLENNPSKRPSAEKIVLLYCDFCRVPKGLKPSQLQPMKVVLFHGEYVGSTELLFRFGQFYGDTTPTLDHPIIGKYADSKFVVFETSGCETFVPINVLYCKYINAVAVVVDVTNMRSLEDARVMMRAVGIHIHGLSLPGILLANKCDLVEKREITAEALAELAEELQCFTYVEVSAKTGQNVKEAFHMLFDKIIAVEWMKSRNSRNHEMPE